jgi:uncharacterized SAM-binding protein YcdF (DUF218 family)
VQFRVVSGTAWTAEECGMLNAVATFLLIPPVNLLAPVFAGLVLARWRPTAGSALAGFSLGALFLLALPATATSMIAVLEQGLPLTAPPTNPPAAIVILGGDGSELAQTSHDRLDDGAGKDYGVGPLSLERERAGAALERRTGLPVLVTDGRVDTGNPPIAMLMARSLAEDFAVPITRVEPDSATTWENATLSAAMLRATGIHSVYLVTHAWHMRRAMLAFRRAGLIVTAAPTRIDPSPSWKAAEFIPQVSVWTRSYYARTNGLAAPITRGAPEATVCMVFKIAPEIALTVYSGLDAPPTPAKPCSRERSSAASSIAALGIGP